MGKEIDMVKTKGHLCPTCRKTKWLKLSCSTPLLPSSSFYYARRNIDVIQDLYHRQSVDGLVAIPRIRKRLNARSPLNPAEPFPVLLPEELCAGSLFIYCNESRIWWLSLVVRANIKKRPRKKRGQSNRECGLNHCREIESNLGLARPCQKKEKVGPIDYKRSGRPVALTSKIGRWSQAPHILQGNQW